MVAYVEANPGAALALEVNEIDERGGCAGSRSQAYAAEHDLPLHEPARDQLHPRAFSILEIGRREGADDWWCISHRGLQTQTLALYSALRPAESGKLNVFRRLA